MDDMQLIVKIQKELQWEYDHIILDRHRQKYKRKIKELNRYLKKNTKQ